MIVGVAYALLVLAPPGGSLLEDERKFIDLPRSPLWWGEERVVVGG